MVDNCAIVPFQKKWNIYREPARPIALRIDYCNGMKFNDNFDWYNAWYDVIQINQNVILLVGPPLYENKFWINNNVTFSDGVNKLQISFYELDRVCYTLLHASRWLDKIYIDDLETPVNKNIGKFNNKKVMVTMQKDNPIEWIAQWVEYHNKLYGVEGFLIYDNNSSKYDKKDIELALSNLNVEFAVVDWPFPYGPQGSDHAPWDSDYSQYVMLEHAKFRYLSNASLILNNDVDELIVMKSEITLEDIRNHLIGSNIQALRYKGTWIEAFDVKNQLSAKEFEPQHRKFKDYYCTNYENNIGIGYKWMLVPNERSINFQWLVHNVAAESIESDQLFYAHLLAMNTNWSWTRDSFDGNTNTLLPNRYLLSNYERIWGNI